MILQILYRYLQIYLCNCTVSGFQLILIILQLLDFRFLHFHNIII